MPVNLGVIDHPVAGPRTMYPSATKANINLMGVPPLWTMLPQFGGVLQRSLFATAYLWYARETMLLPK